MQRLPQNPYLFVHLKPYYFLIYFFKYQCDHLLNKKMFKDNLSHPVIQNPNVKYFSWINFIVQARD